MDELCTVPGEATFSYIKERWERSRNRFAQRTMIVVPCQDCGKDRHVELDSYVRSGSPKYCGPCRGRATIIAAIAKTRKRPFENTYNVFLRRCQERQIDNSITYDQFAMLAKMTTCHYCGGSVGRVVHGNTSRGCGLDRKDNSRGYSVDNVVSCCGHCNRVKGFLLTYEETVTIIGTLALTRGRPVWK